MSESTFDHKVVVETESLEYGDRHRATILASEYDDFIDFRQAMGYVISDYDCAVDCPCSYR